MQSEGTTQVFDMSNHTISAWIKTTNYGAIISKHRNSSFSSSYEMQMMPTGNCKIYFTAPGSSAYSITELNPSNDGNWHHIVGSYDNNRLKIYKDGELDKEGYNPSNINQTTLPTIIGAFRNNSNTGYTAFFDGSIDDIIIYDRALTAQEIQQLYSGSTSGLLEVLLVLSLRLGFRGLCATIVCSESKFH